MNPAPGKESEMSEFSGPVFEKVRSILKESDNIVFFGGAGVSTASGIPDFRSATGLYNRKRNTGYSPEYLLSHEFFAGHPGEFSDYVRENLIYEDAKPNGAHLALAELERRGKLKAVVTQNIDGLHQAAGSKVVYELHGNLTDYYCTRCRRPIDKELFLQGKGVTECPHCGGVVRPDVVLYGEGLDMNVFSAAMRAINKARTFIVGGSSLVVYPAAGLLNEYYGHELILLNQEATPADSRADYVLHGDISKLLPALIAE